MNGRRQGWQRPPPVLPGNVNRNCSVNIGAGALAAATGNVSAGILPPTGSGRHAVRKICTAPLPQRSPISFQWDSSQDLGCLESMSLSPLPVGFVHSQGLRGQRPISRSQRSSSEGRLSPSHQEGSSSSFQKASLGIAKARTGSGSRSPVQGTESDSLRDFLDLDETYGDEDGSPRQGERRAGSFSLLPIRSVNVRGQMLQNSCRPESQPVSIRKSVSWPESLDQAADPGPVIDRTSSWSALTASPCAPADLRSPPSTAPSCMERNKIGAPLGAASRMASPALRGASPPSTRDPPRRVSFNTSCKRALPTSIMSLCRSSAPNSRYCPVSAKETDSEDEGLGDSPIAVAPARCRKRRDSPVPQRKSSLSSLSSADEAASTRVPTPSPSSSRRFSKTLSLAAEVALWQC